jgi:hypothetical protein
MVPPLGIIITVSVLLAAGLAAYENPHVRQWIDRSRQKIAMALHSLGDEIHPRSRSPRQDDPSTREEMSEVAEARRRQARAEIMERSRILEERRKKRKTEGESRNKQGSFDTLVDKNGISGKDGELKDDATAWTTSVDPQEASGVLASRHTERSSGNLHVSVDSSIALRQLDVHEQMQQSRSDPFADLYEQEMRNAWNIPLPQPPSGHASESLMDLTPTSEMAPDPAISVHSSNSPLQHRLNRSDYFSAAASTTSHTLSDQDPEFYYAHPDNPSEPLPSQPHYPSRPEIAVSVSSVSSVAGSTDSVHASELDESDDGIISEFGDGIHTPASAWTEVGSVVSNED